MARKPASIFQSSTFVESTGLRRWRIGGRLGLILHHPPPVLALKKRHESCLRHFAGSTSRDPRLRRDRFRPFDCAQGRRWRRRRLIRFAHPGLKTQGCFYLIVKGRVQPLLAPEGTAGSPIRYRSRLPRRHASRKRLARR